MSTWFAIFFAQINIFLNIQNLSHPDPVIRDEATQNLIEMDIPNYETLRSIIPEQSYPEARLRIEFVIRKKQDPYFDTDYIVPLGPEDNFRFHPDVFRHILEDD